MKKREKSLSKKVLALGLTGALLGSVGYVMPVAAQEIIIEDQATYDKLYPAGDDVKPTALTGNQVTIGTPGSTSTTEPSIGTSGNKKVYGGYTDGSEEVSNNTVTVHSGQMGSVYGGYSQAGDVTGNTVTISGGKVMHVYGGYGSGDATNNKVTISDGQVKGNVVGGYCHGSGTVTGNIVTISGGKALMNVYGGDSRSGDATNNKVIISGGGVKYGIYGGCSYNGSGVITGNKVIISGGTVEGNVYGGYGESASYNGNIKDNSITISSEGGSKPSFGANTVLYGGECAAGSSAKISGNTLNIKTSGITVKNVANFDTYNFCLQNDMAGDDFMLKLTDTTKNTNVKGSSINVSMVGSANLLHEGDKVNLLEKAGGQFESDSTKLNGKITQGVSLEYEATGEWEGGTKLVYTVSEDATVKEQAKSPVETQAAAVGFINSGADMLVSSGMASAVAVAGAGETEIFGAMGGGSMRYKTGSYADVHGYNLAMGVGKAVANNSGKLTFGPFVEYGHGNYSSYLDSGVRGDGTTKYYGLGVLARQDNNSGVYYEGSLRYGRMDADYDSDNIGKVHASYDSSSSYYGAHVGIGKISQLNDTAKADIYAKLLYTHQNGDSVALRGEDLGEVYDFNSIDSTRIRVGSRLSKDYSVRGTGYAGLAYEYEFDGEARATVQGLSTASPSLQGSSGLLELGYILQPKGANDPAIDIGLQGWAGKKQGVSGNVNFVWTF